MFQWGNNKVSVESLVIQTTNMKCAIETKHVELGFTGQDQDPSIAAQSTACVLRQIAPWPFCSSPIWAAWPLAISSMQSGIQAPILDSLKRIVSTISAAIVENFDGGVSNLDRQHENLSYRSHNFQPLWCGWALEGLTLPRNLQVVLNCFHWVAYYLEQGITSKPGGLLVWNV